MNSRWQSSRPGGIGNSASYNDGASSGAGAPAATRTAGASTTADLASSQIHITALFQNIRRVLDQSAEEVALRLGTTPHVLRCLETGKFTELPPWPETKRIVSAYTVMVGIEPHPALYVLEKVLKTPARVAPAQNSLLPSEDTLRNQPSVFGQTAPANEQQFESARAATSSRVPDSVGRISGIGQSAVDSEAGSAVAVSRAVGNRVTQMVRALNGGVKRDGLGSLFHTSGSRFSGRRMVWSLLAAAGITGSLFALRAPAVAEFSRAQFPAPLADVILTVHSALTPARVIEKDGMRWVIVADPRSRRTDRLPMRER